MGIEEKASQEEPNNGLRRTMDMEEKTEPEREEEPEHDMQEAAIANLSPPEAKSKFFVRASSGIAILHKLVDVLDGLVSKMSTAELELMLQ